MKVYQVRHNYAVDGGFGDAVPTSQIVAAFEDKANAKKFIEKYAKPHIYETPYDDLWCGELEIVELTVLTSVPEYTDKDLWWRCNEVIETYDDNEDDDYSCPELDELYRKE